MFNKNKSFCAAFHNKQMENLDDALKDTNRTVQDMPGKWCHLKTHDSGSNIRVQYMIYYISYGPYID